MFNALVVQHLRWQGATEPAVSEVESALAERLCKIKFPRDLEVI